LSTTEVQSLESKAKKAGVDKVLFFTTDTHSLSIKTLISRPDMPIDAVRELLEKAAKGVSPAEFGYGESILRKVRIFGKTYYELVTLVKIMSRVIPVLFALLFLFLVIILWIF
jgi:predicted neutral ceramidase superfamily lipid hydrolase